MCFHRETQTKVLTRAPINQDQEFSYKKKGTPSLIYSGLHFSFVIKYFESYFQYLSHLLIFVFISLSGSRLVWIFCVTWVSSSLDLLLLLELEFMPNSQS